MKHLFVGLILLFSPLLKAENAVLDFTQIDILAQQAPQYANQKINNLVDYCHTNVQNDLEKVRFYFVWIATHIDYDSLELQSAQRNMYKQNCEIVFQNKKGICRGYADLLALLCQKSGISSHVVHGYSKAENGEVDSLALHAWDAIKIMNQWYLFDVTWASNYFDRIHKIDTHFNQYFMQPAFPFIKRHLPFDPIWQLSNKVVKRSDFFSKTSFESQNDLQLIVFSSNYNEIIENDLQLNSMEQTINSFQRAVKFMPEEKRLVDILNYYKSEKAFPIFRQANVILDKFRSLKDEQIAKWTIPEKLDMLKNAEEANFLLAKTLEIYESMIFENQNEDTESIKKNLINIKKNKKLTEKLIEHLKNFDTANK